MVSTSRKNDIHQQKKALNKSIRFLINQKSVSTSQNEGFVEKYDFTGPEKCFHSNQCLEKRFRLTEISIFF